MDTRLFKIHTPDGTRTAVCGPDALPVWPPPEQIYAVDHQGAVLVAEAKPGALESLKAITDAEPFLYERVRYSSLPEQAPDSFVKRSAEYALAGDLA